MVVKINNKSDFKINEWSESIALEVPFEFIYYIPLNKEKYVASYDGHSYINCVRLADGSIDVIFNNHGLGIGRLKVVRKYFVDDLSFADGVFDVISDDQTDVFLTSGKTFDTYVKTLVVPPYLKGDKGDPMTWETMTEKERGELVKDVAEAIDPEMVMTENEKSRQEAERSRQTAEQQRSSTFNTLKGEMQSAITAGNAAAGNAQKVVDEYDTKVAEQDSKLSELGQKVFGNISEYSVVSGVKYDWTFAVDIDIKEGEEFTILLETDAISTTAPHYIGCTEQGKTNKVVYDKFFVKSNIEKTFIATKNTSRLYIPYTATAVKDGFIKLKVSKGGTLADKIDKCNEDINELAEEIEYVRNNIGYLGKSATAEYSVVAETKYDWTFAVDIDINIGEEFNVLFESDVYNGPLYIGYTEQGNTNITAYDNLFVIPNEEKTFVATKNTSRLYVPYQLTPIKDGTIKLYVSVGETLYDKINEIENNVNDLSGDIKEIEGNISSLLPTVYTKEYQVEVGGNYDWKLAVDVDIDEGEEFSILVNTSTTPNHLYFGYTEKGTTKKVAYKDGFVVPNVEKKFISIKNIQTLYIPYSLTPKQNGIFSITVKKGSEIFEKIEEKVKEEVKKLNPHPMNGKTFYSIGDSHRWKWLNKLSELTGGISGGDIFSAALTAYEKYYVSRTVAMAKYIVDLYKSGKPVDYIFMEYVHKYFVNNMVPANWYHYSGDITEAEPFLTQAYYDYTQNTFNNTSEAESFWNDNFASIVGRFTPKSNAIIALKTGVKVQSPKFKLSGSVTTSGNFTIKFTNNSGELHQMSIAIPSGLSINEALTIVNEIEFSDSGSKWDNLSAHNTITDATIKFTYNGNLNDADASIKMGFDFGTTGIVYDGDWTINTETKDWTRGFKSHDVSKWSDKTKWNNLYANVDAYIWIKAAVELLQREIPQAKIFVWTLNTEAWDYNTNTIEGKSVLYPDGMLNVQAIYNSERHKRMVQNLEGWGKVAKYYHLGFIPISEMNNISPANHKYYYPSDDVHPTQEGYDRVAEILARNIY